jgi:hypothetical protein
MKEYRDIRAPSRHTGALQASRPRCAGHDAAGGDPRCGRGHHLCRPASARRTDGSQAPVRLAKARCIDNPIRTSNDVDTLSISNTDELGYVGDVHSARHAGNSPGAVPVIGFVGAPFTMASYMIEGGPSRSFLNTKTDDVPRRNAVAAD